jgi:hypothetical protein
MMKTEIKISLIIPTLFLVSVLLFSTFLSWNYKYGGLLASFLFYGSIIWSVVHIVLLLVKPQLKQKLIWLGLTAIPVLYLCFMLISGGD